MQKAAAIWRASNPMGLLCSYLLIGMFCFKTTNRFSFALSKTTILYFLLFSTFLLCIYAQVKKPSKYVQILPTIILITWG
jgi:hypothetical protein